VLCSIASYKLFYSTKGSVETLSLLFVPPLGGGMEIKMRIIYAEYNTYHNSIDIATYAGYILRIDCGKAEEGL
jgi:hypothetical protein